MIQHMHAHIHIHIHINVHELNNQRQAGPLTMIEKETVILLLFHRKLDYTMRLAQAKFFRGTVDCNGARKVCPGRASQMQSL